MYIHVVAIGTHGTMILYKLANSLTDCIPNRYCKQLAIIALVAKTNTNKHITNNHSTLNTLHY